MSTQNSVMTIELFRIVLDRVVQHPGQPVTGKVQLNTDKKIISKGIYLTIKGGAKCSWTELRPVDEFESKYTIVSFTGAEDYVDERLVLVPLKGGEDLTIPAGRHQYPFEFLLPHHVPSTFEHGTYGHVRYSMRAVVQRNWRPDNQCEVPLNVHTIVDLNAIPTATMKPSAMGSKSVNHTSGPVVAKVWLDRAGYVPGESIFFNAEIKNLSDHEMAGSSVQLIEHRVYQVLHPKFETKKEDRRLAELQRQAFVAGDRWDQVPIPVPPIVPVPYCGIISVDHRLEFRVDLGNGTELTVPLAVTIGNVPLLAEFYRPGAPEKFDYSKAEEAERALPVVPEAHEVPPPADVLPPPSYDECTADGAAAALNTHQSI